MAAANGPTELEPLLSEGQLPLGELNQRQTIDTPVGRIRSSSVPVLLDGERMATYQVVSPLGPVRQEAWEATGLLAAAAGVTLLLGGIMLSLSLWRSLTPLRALADTARSTELRSLATRVPEPDTDDEVGILAREFNTMLDRLEQSSADQREFMARVSHELRTPITIARGHLEVLTRPGAADGRATGETVEIVEDELARMGRLVDDLMAIARAEMPDFAQPRPVDLVGWFEDLELKIAGLRLPPTLIEPPPPVTLTADPDRLAQAVLNLVANAHLHTPEGTRVTVSARQHDDRLAVEVSDDGPGIDASLREQVFRPFVHSGQHATSSGLGLAVVRAVVDAHRGAIDLDTGAHGTRLTLWLPAGGPDRFQTSAEDPATADPAPANPSPAADTPGRDQTGTQSLPAHRENTPTLRLPRPR